MPDSQQFDWEVLIGRFLDNTLDERQCARLADMLAELSSDTSEAGTERKRLIQRQLLTDSLLHDLEKGAGKSPSALDLFASLNCGPPSHLPEKTQASPPDVAAINLGDLVRLAAESPALVQEKQDERNPSPPEKRGRTNSKAGASKKTGRLRWLIVPCLILLCVLVFNEFRDKYEPERSIAASARIIESVEAEWEGEQFKVGREIDPCRMKLKSGLVKIEFADGAVVLLEGPTELLVQEKNKAFCPVGKLSVTVPKRAVGFEVGTPFTSVVDLGTAFVVEVTSEKAEVHVVTGKVELRKSKLEAIPLSEGRAAALDVHGGRKDFQADTDIFCTENKIRDRQTAYVAKRRDVWDRHTERLDSDPSLVYRLRPEEERRLVRVDGSRPGRKALRFRSPKHLLDVPTVKTCRSLTLLARVRIDRQMNLCNTLLIGEGLYSEKGKFLWQLTQDGILQFHVCADPNGDNDRIVRFDTAPLVAPKDRGTWVTLALVADPDEKTIRHYLDGAPVATLPWEKPADLQLDKMTLGNEHSVSRRPVSRFWSGDIEEFLIFDRVLSNEEISEHHRDNL